MVLSDGLSTLTAVSILVSDLYFVWVDGETSDSFRLRGNGNDGCEHHQSIDGLAARVGFLGLTIGSCLALVSNEPREL